MRKLKTVKMLILVIIVVSIGLSATDKGQAGMRTTKAMTEKPEITRPVSEWKTYHNEKWGYSIEYPAKWSARVTLENVGKPEHVIKEEVTFSNPGYGEITLDVWTNQSNLSLWQWFKKNKKWFVGGEAEITKCTATVSELRAICVKEPQTPQAYEVLKCFFQESNSIYRLMYNNSDESQSEQIYEHMLATFKFK